MVNNQGIVASTMPGPALTSPAHKTGHPLGLSGPRVRLNIVINIAGCLTNTMWHILAKI